MSKIKFEIDLSTVWGDYDGGFDEWLRETIKDEVLKQLKKAPACKSYIDNQIVIAISKLAELGDAK